MRVIHEFETEVDADFAEDLIENPGEYEFKEGDECHASAEIVS